MRFITEFELEKYHFEDAWHKAGLQNKKNILQADLGDLISESFGWENPVNGNDCHYRLEIEAFPMDKWVEFRDRIIEESRKGRSNRTNNIIQMFQELESFGKPSGDAITNLSGQMEYRGPSRHCKACEDEKNGVKHIMAQKHTCRK